MDGDFGMHGLWVYELCYAGHDYHIRWVQLFPVHVNH